MVQCWIGAILLPALYLLAIRQVYDHLASIGIKFDQQEGPGFCWIGS